MLLPKLCRLPSPPCTQGRTMWGTALNCAKFPVPCHILMPMGQVHSLIGLHSWFGNFIQWHWHSPDLSMEFFAFMISVFILFLFLALIDTMNVSKLFWYVVHLFTSFHSIFFLRRYFADLIFVNFVFVRCVSRTPRMDVFEVSGCAGSEVMLEMSIGTKSKKTKTGVRSDLGKGQTLKLSPGKMWIFYVGQKRAI